MKELRKQGAARYRKKPIIIEAIQFTGENQAEVIEFGRSKGISLEVGPGAPHIPQEIFIKTLEGTFAVSPGDYVICGEKGELYPWRDEIFRKTYERVK